MTTVKLCGMRTLADARAAADAGADMLGFTFYAGSRRSITPEDACGVIAALRAEQGPQPSICGLFVNANVAEVRAAATLCGLDLVQYAGDEAPEVIAAVGLPAFKTFRPLPDENAASFAVRLAPYLHIAPSLPPGPFGQPLIPLLDAALPGHYGGTGTMRDWASCAEITRDLCRLDGAPYAFLAGGLTPENVGAASTDRSPVGCGCGERHRARTRRERRGTDDGIRSGRARRRCRRAGTLMDDDKHVGEADLSDRRAAPRTA